MVRPARLLVVSLSLVTLVVLAVACASGDPLDDSLSEPSAEDPAGIGGSSDSSGGSAGGSASAAHVGAGGGHGAGASGSTSASGGKGSAGCAPIAPVDPTKLGASCCSKGAARCVPTSSVPGNLASSFDGCQTQSGASGRCMPDDILEKGASYAPKKCTVPIFKVDGVCLSLCIPQIGNDPNAHLLQKATCDEDGEVCVPCISPLDDKPTGACELPAPGCPGGDGKGGSGGGGGSAGSAGAPSGGSACPYSGPPIIDPKTFPLVHRRAAARIAFPKRSSRLRNSLSSPAAPGRAELASARRTPSSRAAEMGSRRAASRWAAPRVAVCLIACPK